MKVPAFPIGELVQFDTSVDGVFIKRIPIPEGVIVPQHAHSHSHATIIARGLIRIWKESIWWGDFEGGTVLIIEAEVKHNFLALKDSEIYCVHNEEHALIKSENKLEFV